MSVRRGEEENIFPFQEQADVMFNSSLLYELAVLKQYVEPLLFGVDGVWWSVATAELLGAVLSVALLVLMRRRYHYA